MDERGGNSGELMSDLEMHWSEWVGEAVYLVLLILLLGLTVVEWRRAYRILGMRLFVLLIIAVPWIAELAIGLAHPFSQHRGGPPWIGQTIEIAAVENPVLWIAALLGLSRAWRCVLPFVAFNLFVAPVVTI